MNNLHKKEALDLDLFHSEFHQTFKEETISILHKLFHNVENSGTLKKKKKSHVFIWRQHISQL